MVTPLLFIVMVMTPHPSSGVVIDSATAPDTGFGACQADDDTNSLADSEILSFSIDSSQFCFYLPDDPDKSSSSILSQSFDSNHSAMTGK